MHTQTLEERFTCVLSNVIQQKGVLSQPLHLCGNDILQLQPATQWITLSILNLNSTITTFVIFIKTIITWMCNIYSSHKRLLLHFPVIKYKTRNAKIYHSDNTSPLHLQLHIGKAHHKVVASFPHYFTEACYHLQSISVTAIQGRHQFRLSHYSKTAAHFSIQPQPLYYWSSSQPMVMKIMFSPPNATCIQALFLAGRTGVHHLSSDHGMHQNCTTYTQFSPRKYSLLGNSHLRWDAISCVGQHVLSYILSGHSVFPKIKGSFLQKWLA